MFSFLFNCEAHISKSDVFSTGNTHVAYSISSCVANNALYGAVTTSCITVGYMQDTNLKE